MNRIFLRGNLTKAPELVTVGDVKKASGSIAWNNPYIKDKDSPKRVSYFNFEVWGQKADVFAENHVKGDRVILEGTLIQDRWDDKESGESRQAVKIRVDEFHFDKSGRNEGGASKPSGSSEPEEAPSDDEIPF